MDRESGRRDDEEERRQRPEHRGVRVRREGPSRRHPLVPERRLTRGKEPREDESPRHEKEAGVAPVQRAAGQERREAERGGPEDDGESRSEEPRARARAVSFPVLHAAQGFRANTRSDIPNDGSVFSSAFSSGMTHLKAPNCRFGRTRRLRTREFSHQPRTPGLFR